MATAAALGPPSSKARPRTMWDVLFDALGDAAVRFYRLTGARIDAGDINSVVMPLGLGAMHVAEKVEHATDSAIHMGARAAYLATHPRAAIHGIDRALRKSGHGQRLDDIYKAGGEVYHFARKGYELGRDLYQRYQDFTDEPYPEKEGGIHGILDRGLWIAAHRIDDASKVFSGLNAVNKFRKLMWGSPKWLKGSERIEKVFNRVFGPIAVFSDVVDTAKDIWHRKWWKAAYHAGKTLFDTYTTIKAWGGDPKTWARRMLRAGGRFATRLWRGGSRLATRLWRGGSRFATRLWRGGSRLATRLGERYLGPAARWSLRLGARVLPRLAPLAERLLPRLLTTLPRAGLWGLAAAALIGAGVGGYYAYTHPKETKEFFHNVGVDLFGTPQQKAKSGWHPWADLTASTLGLVRDVSTLQLGDAWKDVTGAYHAGMKISGAELPPGVKPPPPQPPRSWQEKGWDLVRNVIIPSIPLLGDTLGETIDQGGEFWRMYKQPSNGSQPGGPVPHSRMPARVYAPLAVRAPQPRPRNSNNHAKTQAEIRVRFENAPPSTKVGTRVTGGDSSIFQTGLAFAN